MSKITYKIALLGPTRSGKTSLISSALDEGQKFLNGLTLNPASFTATGSTLKRIQANNNELAGAMAAGSFHSGGLSGTDNATTYTLSLSVGNSTLPIQILDYPGAWLNDNTPLFDEVRKWINDSNILIIPVDAVLVMESSGAAQNTAAKHRMNLAAIEHAAEHWARERILRKSPGMVLFVPVKCESYFSDNGGRRDQSNSLSQRVLSTHYKRVIDKVQKESEGHDSIKAYYMPVDTMGCVELVAADWEINPADKRLECSAVYRIRGSGERTVFGAGDVLVAIAKMIAGAAKSDSGYFSKLWGYLTGDNKALAGAIDSLGKRPWGSRVREIAI